MIFEIEIGQLRKVNRKIRSKIRIRNLVRITETGYYSIQAEGLDFQYTLSYSRTIWRSSWADKVQDSIHRRFGTPSETVWCLPTFKRAQPEKSMDVPAVLELPIVLYTWDIREAMEEAIWDHPPSSHQVLTYPLNILEMVEVGMAFTLWRLFPWLDEKQIVKCKPRHRIGIWLLHSRRRPIKWED